MALGLRYPKAHEMGFIPPENGGGPNSSAPQFFDSVFWQGGANHALYVAFRCCF